MATNFEYEATIASVVTGTPSQGLIHDGYVYFAANDITENDARLIRVNIESFSSIESITSVGNQSNSVHVVDGIIYWSVLDPDGDGALLLHKVVDFVITDTLTVAEEIDISTHPSFSHDEFIYLSTITTIGQPVDLYKVSTTSFTVVDNMPIGDVGFTGNTSDFYILNDIAYIYIAEDGNPVIFAIALSDFSISDEVTIELDEGILDTDAALEMIIDTEREVIYLFGGEPVATENPEFDAQNNVYVISLDPIEITDRFPYNYGEQVAEDEYFFEFFLNGTPPNAIDYENGLIYLVGRSAPDLESSAIGAVHRINLEDFSLETIVDPFEEESEERQEPCATVYDDTTGKIFYITQSTNSVILKIDVSETSTPNNPGNPGEITFIIDLSPLSDNRPLISESGLLVDRSVYLSNHLLVTKEYRHNQVFTLSGIEALYYKRVYTGSNDSIVKIV